MLGGGAESVAAAGGRGRREGEEERPRGGVRGLAWEWEEARMVECFGGEERRQRGGCGHGHGAVECEFGEQWKRETKGIRKRRLRGRCR